MKNKLLSHISSVKGSFTVSNVYGMNLSPFNLKYSLAKPPNNPKRPTTGMHIFSSKTKRFSRV